MLFTVKGVNMAGVMLLKELEFDDKIFDQYKNWYFQEKQNGERALMSIKNGKVTDIRNRNGNNVKPRWPELAGLEFPGIQSALIDFEACVMINGKSMFYNGINQRRAIPTPDRLKFPVTAMAFDLLHIDGQPLTGKAYRERYALLKSKFSDNEHFKVVENIDNPRQYWNDRVVSENREGLVLKDPSSIYLPDQRVASQLKLKYYKRADVTVQALEPNPKGVKITGYATVNGQHVEAEVQWSSMGFENIKIGDVVEVEFLDIVNNKMVQPHKVKGSIVD